MQENEKILTDDHRLKNTTEIGIFQEKLKHILLSFSVSMNFSSMRYYNISGLNTKKKFFFSMLKNFPKKITKNFFSMRYYNNSGLNMIHNVCDFTFCESIDSYVKTDCLTRPRS